MPPLNGNAILISSVLFYWKNWISVKVLAEYSFLVHFSFKPQTSVFKFFFAVYNRSVHRALFFKKKLKKESYEKASPRSWRPRVAGCQKKTKNSAESRRKGREEEPKGETLRGRLQQRRLYDEMVVKTFLLKHIKDPCKEKLRDAIRNHVDSHSKSIVKASSVLMHLAREMYRDVTHTETVEIPDEFFDKTFIRHLMLGTAEALKENVLVHALHENLVEFRFEGNRYRGASDI